MSIQHVLYLVMVVSSVLLVIGFSLLSVDGRRSIVVKGHSLPMGSMGLSPDIAHVLTARVDASIKRLSKKWNTKRGPALCAGTA